MITACSSAASITMQEHRGETQRRLVHHTFTCKCARQVLVYKDRMFTELDLPCLAGQVLLSSLRRICGVSLRDHVQNVDILTRCNTFAKESQLQSKRLGWLGHLFRMPDDRLPKKLLVGQVKGCRPPNCRRGHDKHGSTASRMFTNCRVALQ